MFRKFNADSLVSVVEVPHSYNPKNLYSFKTIFLKPLNSKNILNLAQKRKSFMRETVLVFTSQKPKI